MKIFFAIFALAVNAVAQGTTSLRATHRKTLEGASRQPLTRSEFQNQVLLAELDTAVVSRGDKLALVEGEQQEPLGNGHLSVGLEPAGSGSSHNQVDDLKGGPGCSIQCIMSGRAYAYLTGARLVVETDTQADIELTVTIPGNDELSWYASGNTGADLEFSHVFDGLMGGITYEATVVATDGEGYSSTASGTFKTLVRNVEITYGTIESDGDFQVCVDPATASPIYEKWLWINNGWVNSQYEYGLHPLAAVPGDFSHLVPYGASCPSKLFFSTHFHSINNAPKMLDMKVQLREYNLEGDDCENDYNPTEPTTESIPGTCRYKNYAQPNWNGDPINLDERPSGATSFVEHTIETHVSSPTPSAFPLSFQVGVVLHVFYN